VLAASVAFGAFGALACDDPASPYFGSTRREGRDAATFSVNALSEPEYLDPGKCSDAACAALVTQLFEGLTRYHPEDARPVQGVAERWEKSDDNRIYRFHLRPDARWSDGRPVTAGDFEYAWKRVLRPSTMSRAASNLYVLENAELFRLGKLQALRVDGPFPAGTVVRVLERAGGRARVQRWSRLPLYQAGAQAGAASPPEPTSPGTWVPEGELVEDDRVVGVRAAGDLTLEVELEQPAPYFLDLTSHHAYSPVRRDVIEAFERRGEGDLWTRPSSFVGNGPYVIESWAFQYEIAMKQSPFYWDRDRLKIHRIVWAEVEDYHASMNLYKAGELDYLGDSMGPPAEYQALLSGKKDYQRNDYLAVYWYELNTRRPPLDDPRVRHALDLALDKVELCERVTRGGQRPATHYVPDFTGSGYAEQAASDRARGADPFAGGFDPDQARALLAEAGYAPLREGGEWRAPGFPSIEILYNTGEGNRQVAIAVQAMWKQNLGVTARLRNEEWKVMLKTYRDGDFDVVRFGQTADYNHPQTFLDPFLASDPQNHTGWSDEVFEETMRRAAGTADPAESIRLYREAERRAVLGMPRIPLYFYARSTLVKPWVKGFWGSARNPHAIQFLWIDPAWQQGGPNVPAYPPPELPPPRVITP
jgi:oligopeptide transport system substrate-binding protein